MTEEWKTIFDGAYSVSSLGRVRREISRTSGKAGTIMRPIVDAKGYHYVKVCNGATLRRRRPIHQLVAHAFIGECPAGHEVNHINAVRGDNRLENLEYVTRQANVRYAANLGHMKGPGLRGENHGESKLTEDAVVAIRRARANGVTLKTLAAEYGVTIGCIRHAALGHSWSHVPMETAS